MKLIIQHNTDSGRNLATEEALFQTVTEDTLYLWQNHPSVIIGRNQNTLAEIDIDFAHEKNIKVVRRLTGGGAVYQDLGNLNFSYIFRCSDGAESFDEKVQQFLDMFIVYLRFYDIEPVMTGRNDICIKDSAGNLRKIAGTAMTQKGDRGIFHLCLLFDVDMEMMERVLTPPLTKLQSKGVASVRSRTVNLKEACPQAAPWSKAEFFAAAAAYFQKSHTLISLGTDIESSIDDLSQNRYENDSWTFGRNPLASVSHSKRFPIGTVEAALGIRGGKISACDFRGDFLTASGLEAIAEALMGKDFDQDYISAALSGFAIENIFNITDRREFIDFLLGRST